jgi:hypothetical protein
VPRLPSTLDDLLREIQSGLVIGERYSRKSVLFRVEPVLATGLLAIVAILGGMLLGGLGSRSVIAPGTDEPSRGPTGR